LWGIPYWVRFGRAWLVHANAGKITQPGGALPPFSIVLVAKRIEYQQPRLALRAMASNKPFGKVIVCFDGSNDSIKAIKLAGSFASNYQSEVTIVHVYSSPAVGFSAASGIPIPDYKALEDAKKETAKSVLAKGVRAASDEGFKAKGELIEAPSVVEAMVEFATTEKADLIIVGTRGMTGFKKLILGSVSSGLVNHAPCNVLVAR